MEALRLAYPISEDILMKRIQEGESTMAHDQKQDSGKGVPVNTLILVLGVLAALSLLGYIGISLMSGRPSAEALVGICSAIVGYLGGLLTPTQKNP